jgi:hypothetical protein
MRRGEHPAAIVLIVAVGRKSKMEIKAAPIVA